ncbi:hypothetical protein Pan216_08180 [Planctomycetes bacterium Pan216]|uniref:Uncharacterized protein n=1 Tax=Kolteria novifilia TaxID=2527975 RepID=A0A518AZ24_9BACT|nr:hypothetical protein Pan216_08180 [Planctomycetes bacterium Pan216]
MTSTTTSLLCLTLATLGADSGKVYELRETVQPGQQTTTTVELTIKGQIQSSDMILPMAGRARLVYPERVIEVGDDGLPSKVLRFYEDARAKFVIATDHNPRQLRPDGRLIVGKRDDNKMILWPVAGPVTGDEMELIKDALDTTALAGLLPTTTVAKGEPWKPEVSVIQTLAGFDHFASGDVSCELESIDDAKATIIGKGKVVGISLGTRVESEIDMKLVFDRKKDLITEVEWKQKDARAVGPVSPSGQYNATVTVKRDRPEKTVLTDEIVKQTPLKETPVSRLVLFEDPAHDVRFHYGHDWHITALRPDQAILRQFDGEDFLVQLNVTFLPKRAAGTVMSMDEFQSLIMQDKGWTVEEVIGYNENVPTDGSYKVNLLTAHGHAGGSKLVQKHYLATGNAGQQVIFSFLLDPDHDEQLGTQDLSLVSTLEFPSRTAQADENPKR